MIIGYEHACLFLLVNVLEQGQLTDLCYGVLRHCEDKKEEKKKEKKESIYVKLMVFIQGKRSVSL